MGAFGTVFRSRTPSGCVVVIKQVMEDEDYANREAGLCKTLTVGSHLNAERANGPPEVLLQYWRHKGGLTWAIYGREATSGVRSTCV